MSNTLKFSASYRISGSLTSGGAGLSAPTNKYPLSQSISFTNGTGVGAADQIYGAMVTIGAGAHQVYDLYGSLADGLGGTFNCTKLKYIYIANLNTPSSSANGVLVCGAPSTVGEYFEIDAPYGPAPHEFSVVPGGTYANHNPNGWPLVNGVSDWLDVHNLGSVSVSYEILLVGASA